MWFLGTHKNVNDTGLATMTFLILGDGDANTDATTMIRKFAECSFSFWTLLVSHEYSSQKDSTFMENS